MSAEVRPSCDILLVDSPARVREFVELPYVMYAADRRWIPPLRRDEKRRLSVRHNPFLEHADMELWLARSNGRVVGRIAAIEDRLYNEKHGERSAWFGFLEAADAGVARDLLRVVEQWSHSRTATCVRGPVNPSLNESAGLLIEGFDEDPYILMPYNPPAYRGFVEDAGYRKAKDLLAWSLDATVPIGDRITRVAERAKKRHGIVIRPVDLAAFDRDLGHLQRVYRSAWDDNWGFVPPTDAEIRQLASDLKPILDPEIVLFAEIDGRVVGCAVAIPDLNQVLKRMNGRLLPVGFLQILRRRSIITQARVLLVGVLQEARHLGLYPLLIAEIFRRGVARGYRRAELSWTLEDNEAVNAGIKAAGGQLSKVYRLYEKRLAPAAELGSG